MYWRNYFGDQGVLEIETVKTNNEVADNKNKNSKNDSKKDIEVQLVEQQRLTLEKPQMVTFRLHNMTRNHMKLQLSVSDVY